MAEAFKYKRNNDIAQNEFVECAIQAVLTMLLLVAESKVGGGIG